MSDGKLGEVRAFFAKMMAAASGSSDPRLERIFEGVPREAFLGAGPWKIMVGKRYIQTPSQDPIHLYHNALIALDETRMINNGEPFLHARWLGASAIQAGDVVTHIGAGTGYYSAIMSMLALPCGSVTAFEIDERLAQSAAENLKPFRNVSVIAGDATTKLLPTSDVIYVNAGAVRPPVSWLDALKPNGRLIFPWSPAPRIGIAVLITRRAHEFEVKPLMPAWFIPCIGASDPNVSSLTPNAASAWQIQSLHKKKNRKPDGSAVATYEDIWFSNKSVSE